MIKTYNFQVIKMVFFYILSYIKAWCTKSGNLSNIKTRSKAHQQSVVDSSYKNMTMKPSPIQNVCRSKVSRLYTCEKKKICTHWDLNHENMSQQPASREM